MLLPVNEKKTELSKGWCLNDLFMDLQMRIVRADAVYLYFAIHDWVVASEKSVSSQLEGYAGI